MRTIKNAGISNESKGGVALRKGDAVMVIAQDAPEIGETVIADQPRRGRWRRVRATLTVASVEPRDGFPGWYEIRGVAVAS